MRLRWVVAALREWAAWIDDPQPVRSVRYGQIPCGRPAGNWMPKDARSCRRTHKAFCRLSPEHAKTLLMVYVWGPRRNITRLTEIAQENSMTLDALRKKLYRAEARLADELDGLDPADGGEGL